MEIKKKGIKNYELSDRAMYIIVGIISAIVFISIYGYYTINPFYTDWMMEEVDVTLVFLSVQAYLNSDWHFPIGLIDTISYPFYVPIIFQDALCMFSIPQKILYPILPKNIQLFGLWQFMSYILQGIITAKILKNFTKNNYLVILASILFLYVPSVIFRAYGHISLSGHWVILLTFELLLLSEKYINNKNLYYKIALIGMCSSLMHIYFILINGIILCGVCLEDILKNKRFKKSIYMLVTYLGSVIVTVYLLGGFSLRTDTSGGGLGLFSFNLNALFNPQGYAQIFNTLPLYTPHQYEGFAYLGAGCIFLLLYSLFTILDIPNIKQSIKSNEYKILALITVGIVALIVTLSPVVTLGSHLLVDYTNALPSFILKLWSTFRGSGRVAWILVYIIMFSSVIILFKKENKMNIAIILIFSIGLQIYDIQPLIKWKNGSVDKIVEYDNKLVNNEFCDSLLENNDIKHITITEPYSEVYTQDVYTIAYWAFQNDMTINTFYMARPLGEVINEEITKSLANPTSDTLYVFYEDNRYDCLNYDLNYYKVDNLIFGYINEVEGYNPLVLPRDLHAVYEIGTDIAFCGETYNADKYATSGFSAKEPDFTWTNSDCSDIKFTSETKADKLKCFIELKDVFNKTQDVTILVNGQEVYHQVVNSGENIEFEFDNSNNSDGVFDIEILLPGAVSPSELGLSTDERKLSLAINHITFTEVRE